MALGCIFSVHLAFDSNTGSECNSFDRVNMRMVGVPEASLDIWANQFVAKGYKIARRW